MTVPEAPATVAPALAFPAPPPAPGPVRFVGQSGAYWWLLIRGAMLLAVTLGIYRFWLATDVRRFLWSNTEVAGESLEYSGTPQELLIGFLIALALLTPIYVGFFVVALSLGAVGQAVSSLGFPVLFVLGQFAIFRARRYRLTRTVFRGVRFHQSGSAVRFAVCATFWWLLIALTLGLAYPFAQARLERYKMRRTHYGDLTGDFTGSGLRLFLRGLPMWLVTVGPLSAVLVGSAAAVDWRAFGEAVQEGRVDTLMEQVGGVQVALGFVTLGAIASAVMAAILFPAFQAMTLRWWISGLRMGDVAVGSRLRTRRIYGAYFRLIGWGLAFLIAFGILGGLAAAVAYGVVSAGTPRSLIEIAGAAGGVVLYVIMMLGFSTIYQATVKLALWRHGMESAGLTNIEALDRVQAAGQPSSAVGEGLADALSVGGF